MSQVVFQNGAPTGAGSSIINPPLGAGSGQPTGVAQDLAIVGVDNVIEVGPDIGTLYVGTNSATDVSIIELTPGFNGQRLLVQAINIGSTGGIKFLDTGTSAGAILDLRIVDHTVNTAFTLRIQGDMAILCYSSEGLAGNAPGWYVNEANVLS